MAVNIDELRALPVSEKLRLCELLWDELGASTEPIPLPSWVGIEATKRLDEMLTDPSLGLTHEEAWQRIDQRKG
jgi:putative addiction module component (TIGR02574 family)